MTMPSLAGDAGVSAPPASPPSGDDIADRGHVTGLAFAAAFTLWAILVAVPLVGSLWPALVIVGLFISLATGAVCALSRM